MWDRRVLGSLYGTAAPTYGNASGNSDLDTTKSVEVLFRYRYLIQLQMGNTAMFINPTAADTANNIFPTVMGSAVSGLLW